MWVPGAEYFRSLAAALQLHKKEAEKRYSVGQEKQQQ
jgi:hypothetical protein